MSTKELVQPLSKQAVVGKLISSCHLHRIQHPFRRVLFNRLYSKRTTTVLSPAAQTHAAQLIIPLDWCCKGGIHSPSFISLTLSRTCHPHSTTHHLAMPAVRPIKARPSRVVPYEQVISLDLRAPAPPPRANASSMAHVLSQTTQPQQQQPQHPYSHPAYQHYPPPTYFYPPPPQPPPPYGPTYYYRPQQPVVVQTPTPLLAHLHQRGRMYNGRKEKIPRPTIPDEPASRKTMTPCSSASP
jgi:hypothetical protein